MRKTLIIILGYIIFVLMASLTATLSRPDGFINDSIVKKLIFALTGPPLLLCESILDYGLLMNHSMILEIMSYPLVICVMYYIVFLFPPFLLLCKGSGKFPAMQRHPVLYSMQYSFMIVHGIIYLPLIMISRNAWRPDFI